MGDRPSRAQAADAEADACLPRDRIGYIENALSRQSNCIVNSRCNTPQLAAGQRIHSNLSTIVDQQVPRGLRRFLRFRVRALIVAVLLFGGYLGWIVNRAHERHLVIAALERSGGGVEFDWQFKNGRHFSNPSSRWPKWLVDLVGADHFHDVTWALVGFGGVNDTTLLRIGCLSQLEELDLNDVQSTDAGLANLSGLRALRKVHLKGRRFTDRALANLKGLPSLRELGLRECTFTDDGLKNLERLSELQILGLTDCKITDAGLAHLKDLRALTNLGLTNCQITDAGLSHLKEMTNLEYLILNRTNITDLGLAHLKALKRLRFLSLADTKVSDAGLKHLHGNAGLVLLWLKGTRVTDAGVGELKVALPTLSIAR
jgi:hypothetical protein